IWWWRRILRRRIERWVVASSIDVKRCSGVRSLMSVNQRDEEDDGEVREDGGTADDGERAGGGAEENARQRTPQRGAVRLGGERHAVYSALRRERPRACGHAAGVQAPGGGTGQPCVGGGGQSPAVHAHHGGVARECGRLSDGVH